MNGRFGPRSRLARTAALLALGGLAVHQLRYVIAFGGSSGETLHREGHAYLVQAAPILLALATAALVATVLAGASTSRRLATAARPSLTRGLFYAASLAAIFTVQELAEGALASHHPAGPAAFLAAGGWLAFPLSLALGLTAGVVEHALQRVDGALGRMLVAVIRSPPGPTPHAPVTAPDRPPLAARALAFGLARRPPPLIPIT